MLRFIFKRVLWMIPSLFAVSFLAFVLIQLPPGDFVTNYVATLAASNEIVDQQAAEALRERFGLGEPMLWQYGKWMVGILTRGDFGISFEWQQPVSGLLWERMALTLALTLSTLVATWAIALPIGIFSAVKKYSIGDYIVTSISFLGLAIPSFLLALVLMYVAVVIFGQDVSGLFSDQYQNAPWTWGKVVDLIHHLWIPVIILAVSGTASLIRVMRANMLGPRCGADSRRARPASTPTPRHPIGRPNGHLCPVRVRIGSVP
jgi:peptide/nickel transport system permease protein